MKRSSIDSGISRRDFVKNSPALAVFAAAGVAPLCGAGKPEARKMIGVQAGSVSFVDEGVGTALGILQERAAADTNFLTTFTYGRGLAGRQIPGYPFPDLGVQESDAGSFHGGNYATLHPEFYRHTVLKQTRAPDHGELDIVAAVLPETKKRGLRLFCSVEDVFRSEVPGVREVAKVDLEGHKAGTLCLFNPEVRAFWTGLVTDLCRAITTRRCPSTTRQGEAGA